MNVIIPKTCLTCAHKRGTVCMLSGYHIVTERKFPTVCGIDFDGWVQKSRTVGLVERIKTCLFGSI